MASHLMLAGHPAAKTASGQKANTHPQPLPGPQPPHLHPIGGHFKVTTLVWGPLIWLLIHTQRKHIPHHIEGKISCLCNHEL